ncbi:endonuclease NucS domain-containing protein [Geothrix sp. SG200]|uniref:endonuclease NucS domain-containing protein n=1 Tax=Geothrix sp. SG200 TaxID=2922865 RepID=UPI001FABA889|nr:endonuclease NucS domain-containing protein [Geothrix sp. SG200]
MPFQHTLYRIDQGLKALSPTSLGKEELLEDFIFQDVSILNERWLLIGRQVRTDYGKFIDLLAVDENGSLVVIELKKHMTPREVTAQALDYAAWVEHLEPQQIAEIWQGFVKNYRPELGSQSLDQAFLEKFNTRLDEVNLNEEHRMVVVAAKLDSQTERILAYLGERGIPINAVFFEVFTDGAAQFLSRVWFQDPLEATDPLVDPPKPKERGPWNGEFYVSFGVDERRTWEDAVQIGFISGGGGRWYSNTLNYLKPGDRVWVNVPKKGYVGVGRVLEPAVKVTDFKVELPGGELTDLANPNLKLASKGMFNNAEDDDAAEYLVRVNWEHTVPLTKAVKEVGFFGNQNTVCRPSDPKWDHTVERLKQVWNISQP